MSYISDMQTFFGPESSWPAFRAVAEDQMLDFRAIMIPERDEPDLPFIGTMRPNPAKEFYMEISDTEKRADEWIVTTTNGRWAFRRLTDDQRAAFIAALQSDGVDVG